MQRSVKSLISSKELQEQRHSLSVLDMQNVKIFGLIVGI